MIKKLKCLKNSFPCYISLAGLFAILFVCPDYELKYLRNLRQLMVRVVGFIRLTGFELKCFERSIGCL